MKNAIKKIIGTFLCFLLYVLVFWAYGSAFSISKEVPWYYGVILMHLIPLVIGGMAGIVTLIFWLFRDE